jgi:hypothetical protein
MPMDQLVSVAESGRASIGKCNVSRIKVADDGMDARVGGRAPAFLFGGFAGETMNGRYG